MGRRWWGEERTQVLSPLLIISVSSQLFTFQCLPYFFYCFFFLSCIFMCFSLHPDVISYLLFFVSFFLSVSSPFHKLRRNLFCSHHRFSFLFSHPLVSFLFCLFSVCSCILLSLFLLLFIIKYFHCSLSYNSWPFSNLSLFSSLPLHFNSFPFSLFLSYLYCTFLVFPFHSLVPTSHLQHPSLHSSSLSSLLLPFLVIKVKLILDI